MSGRSRLGIPRSGAELEPLGFNVGCLTLRGLALAAREEETFARMWLSFEQSDFAKCRDRNRGIPLAKSLWKERKGV